MSGPQAVADLPLWAAVVVALLLVLAGVLSFVGALGLLRLPNFYQRVHAPSISITLGTGCMLIASMLHSTWQEGRPVLHELVITAMVLLTAPVVSMMLMRAAVYRELHARRLRASGQLQVQGMLEGDDTQTAREGAQEEGMEAIVATRPAQDDPGR